MKLFMLSSRDAVLDPEHAFIPAHHFATPLADGEIELNRVNFFGGAGARGRGRGREGGRRGGRLGGARRLGNDSGGATEGHDGLAARPSEVSDGVPDGGAADADDSFDSGAEVQSDGGADGASEDLEAQLIPDELMVVGGVGGLMGVAIPVVSHNAAPRRWLNVSPKNLAAWGAGGGCQRAGPTSADTSADSHSRAA